MGQEACLRRNGEKMQEAQTVGECLKGMEDELQVIMLGLHPGNRFISNKQMMAAARKLNHGIQKIHRTLPHAFKHIMRVDN